MTIDDDDHRRVATLPPSRRGVLECKGRTDIEGAARAAHDTLQCHGLPSASVRVGDNGNVF